MTAPADPRDELTPEQRAEMERLFAQFDAASPLRRAIAEGRARLAGYEPLLAFADTAEGAPGC